MTVEELKIKLINNSDVLLIDVRETHELSICKITPSLHMPMSNFTTSFTNLPKHKELVIYCHHGIRSQMVVNFLKQQTYKKVKNLDGGIDKWAQLIEPTMKRY